MNWRERINAAINNGGWFTIQDRLAAENWDTCAVGVQDQRIPRLEDWGGQPEDSELCLLGCNFTSAVNTGCPWLAHIVLDQIEVRSAEILRKMELHAA